MPHRNSTLLRCVLSTVLVASSFLVGPSQRAESASDLILTGPAGSGAFGQNLTVLNNGNLVVSDPGADYGGLTDVGAVYLYSGGDGALLSTLRGSTTGDQVGSGGIQAVGNSNYLVLSPDWSNGAAASAGAVTWLNGASGGASTINVSNSLIGLQAGDRVGSAVVVSVFGNYMVSSPYWSNGSAASAGAVTWGNGATGVVGIVGASNSLVGSQANDQVGLGGVVMLANAYYVVSSPLWDNAAVADAGAVTWGSESTGVTGVVSAANSLVGDRAGNQVGSGVAMGFQGIVPLGNQNFVVNSPNWSDGSGRSGAITWANGNGSTVGVVSASNSLVGASSADQVGQSYYSVVALLGGNYVVKTPMFDLGANANVGAITWGNGSTGTSGVIGTANSLVGSTAEDQLGGGFSALLALTGGNYVFASPLWDNGAVANAGAVTWVDGNQTTTGVVDVTNSLVGTTAGDGVGASVVALTNGNYVVTSPTWNGYRGAATWGNGASGTVGAVTAANSLVGSTSGDQIGYSSVIALRNGNYVVKSPFWQNLGAPSAGAVTWGNGSGGTVGAVSATNSLVGTFTGASLGIQPNSVVALASGHYVVSFPNWQDGGLSNLGAVVWGNGTTGVVGPVTAANSLHGTTPDDQVGSGDGYGFTVVGLSDGNYLVKSPAWHNGAIANAGAVTWGNGTTGITGAVSAANSLVGSTAGDALGAVVDSARQVGLDFFVVVSPTWDNGGLVDAGAVTIGPNGSGLAGPLTDWHTVRGGVANQGGTLTYRFNFIQNQLVVGQPAEQKVTLRRINAAPLANAGPDHTVASGATVTLNGSGSSDADGDLPLTYAWTQSAGPAVTLSSPNAANPTFTAPASDTVLTFSLSVTDGLGTASWAPDEVTITVTTQAVAPSAAVLSGPSIGVVGTAYDYTATIQPTDALTPIVYVWEVNGQSPVTHTVGISDTLAVTWDVTGTQTITVTATNGIGAAVTASHTTTLVAGAEAELDPGGGQLTYTPAGGGSTDVIVPAGALTTTTTLLLEAQSDADPASGYAFAGTAFTLNAYRDGVAQTGFTFAAPVTLTLSYTNEQLAGQDEQALTLMVRSGGVWTDAAATCAPISPYVREPSLNRLSVAICHLSDYALMGQHRVLIPLVRK